MGLDDITGRSIGTLEPDCGAAMTKQAADGPARCLSPACRDVLYLLGRGKTTAQIADLLHLSPDELDNLIALLQERFGAADAHGLRVRIILTWGHE